jgi:low temperature requirement protein LtrA
MILAVAYIANFFIPLNIEHITERLANFIVLVLGEDVASLFFVETGDYIFEPYLLGLLGMVIVFGFQMLYFDVEETSRHRLLHAMRRRKYTGQLWSILHIFYTMSLVVLAAGVGLAIDATLPDEQRKSKHTREDAESRSRLYFTGGFAGALMASTIIGSLHKWHHTLETIPKWFRFMVRVTACFYIISFSLILEDMAWMVGTGAAIMVAVIIIELVGGQKKRGITDADVEDEEIGLNQSQAAIREGNFLA